jgi:hypothetical protein
MQNPDVIKKLFWGRKLVIATKHEKQTVIGPIIEKGLGVTCLTPTNFDTDNFGTFSGEVERKDDQLTTARKKCMAAMQQSGCDMGIASEGAFGPHPTAYFIPAGFEILVFIDAKNNIEVSVSTISTATNFYAGYVQTKKELEDLAHRVQFPSHALIIRKSEKYTTGIIKGITKWDDLYTHFENYRQQYGKAFIETDMRAMHNPTRMQVIKELSEKLLQAIINCCPTCNMPGFNITDIKTELPCGMCGLPGKAILSHVYTCRHCGCEQEQMYPNQKQFADPMYCDYCNP